MSHRPGILIMSDRHLIVDVQAEHWSPPEIRRRLETKDKIAFLDIGHDGHRMAISEFLNFSTAGKPSRFVGFELFGETVYGNALIIGREDTDQEIPMDPQYIAHRIHFLRLEHSCA